MTTRFLAGSESGVPSGYESQDVPSDIDVPACGIEDVDQALFRTFDQELRFEVSDGKSGATKKVPIIFASGERWALIKRGQPLRDKQDTLVLPLITIRRTSLEQAMADDVTGRGINQQTGELVVKRRLSERDRAYQSLVNKLGLVNQTNVASPAQTADGQVQVSTFRTQFANAHDTDVIEGGLLNQKLPQDVWEIITIPAPQFFKATYEVTFWTQYTIHMNQILQKLLASYLPQGQALRLDTDKGYWFVASVEGNAFVPEDNADDFSAQERIVKYKATFTVPGFLVAAGGAPGVPATTRRYVSAPTISFQIGGAQAELEQNVLAAAPDVLSGSNDPSDPYRLTPLTGLNAAFLTPAQKNRAGKYGVQVSKNPFPGANRTEYVRVAQQNPATGESVLVETGDFDFVILDR